MNKSCDKCIHFDVCKYRTDIQGLTPSFVDYEAPNASTWLKHLWLVLGERCRYFKSKSDES